MTNLPTYAYILLALFAIALFVGAAGGVSALFVHWVEKTPVSDLPKATNVSNLPI